MPGDGSALTGVSVSPCLYLCLCVSVSLCVVYGQSQALSARYMRKSSMWSSLFGGKDKPLSPTETEALLVNAESHLLQAVVQCV